jgi:hypothetical protein
MVYQVEVVQVLQALHQVQADHQVHLVLQAYQVRVDQVLHQLLQAVQVPQLLQVHLEIYDLVQQLLFQL